MGVIAKFRGRFKAFFEESALRLVILGLATLVPWTVVVFLLARNSDPLMSTWLDNLWVELVGIMLAALFLSIPLEVWRRTHKKRLELMGLQGLREHIAWYIRLLLSFYISASRTSGFKPVSTIDRFFDDDYFGAVAQLDFRALSWRGNAKGALSWFELLAEEIEDLQKGLKNVVTLFGIHFDTAFTEQLVRFSRSEFLQASMGITQSGAASTPEYRAILGHGVFAPMFRRHVKDEVQGIVEAFNRRVDSKDSLDLADLLRDLQQEPLGRMPALQPGASRMMPEVTAAETTGANMNSSPPAQLVYQDRPDVVEVYADVIGPILFDGTAVRIEFGTRRLDAPPTENSPPTFRGFPVARIAIGAPVAAELQASLAQVLGQEEQQRR